MKTIKILEAEIRKVKKNEFPYYDKVRHLEIELKALKDILELINNIEDKVKQSCFVKIEEPLEELKQKIQG